MTIILRLLSHLIFIFGQTTVGLFINGKFCYFKSGRWHDNDLALLLPLRIQGRLHYSFRSHSLVQFSLYCAGRLFWHQYFSIYVSQAVSCTLGTMKSTYRVSASERLESHWDLSWPGCAYVTHSNTSLGDYCSSYQDLETMFY